MVDKPRLRNKILNDFPYPIAVRYKAMLETESLEIKAHRCVFIFEAGLRAITLGVLGQYVQRDLEVVNDKNLNRTALKLILQSASLGTWTTVFFNALKAYRGHRDRLFMTELYDFYWNIEVEPHRSRKGIQRPFQQLVELRNKIVHNPPTSLAFWQSAYEEIDDRLHEVLNQLLFLAEYDLIYVVEQNEKGVMYDAYTGHNVHRGELFQTEQLLEEGWCYLSKATGEFLPVHPLIIFWEDELSLANLRSDPEVVIYDSYKVQRLKYWHSSAGGLETENVDLLDLFISRILEKLQAQRPRQQVSRLNWSDLRSLSRQIALQRMGDARQKYNARLYLQRQDTRETFDKFLQSDKNCLILTGNSGVGKSNFLLSLIDEFDDSETVYALAYNGARLDSHIPFDEILAKDFNYHLKFRESESPDGPSLLRMIDEIEGRQNQKIVIFMDAINENPNGKQLLRNIDRLIENLPYPWLKIVITSRPEAWRSIKRGIRLTEHRYFRQEGKDELGAEITGFDFVVRVDPFAYEELPRVYEKYRAAYRLTTQYEEIPAPIKKQLRDPLTLLLVAETYHDSVIPSDIRSSELIEKYVKVLVATERLDRTDLSFLQNEIVPRLFQPPYSPQLLPNDIEHELTTDGRSLHEQVFNSDLLPGGRKVNQSYSNLADSAILIEQDSQLEQVIGFKYERFYEYFGGIYLSQAAHTRENPLAEYESLSGELDSKPYLWGVLKNALLDELRNGRSSLVRELAELVFPSDRLLRNAIVYSLVEYKDLNSEDVSKIVNDMVRPLHGPAQSIVETTRRLIFRKRYNSVSLTSEQSIAIEVAGRLGFEELLTKASADRVRAVRQAAILHSFYLWRSDSQAGYRIMHQLGDYAVAGWELPDPGATDALISLIISIITYDHLNPEIQRQAVAVARQVLRQLLFLNPEEHRTFIGRLRFQVWRLIRRPLLSFAIGWGLKIIASWGADGLPANVKTLSNFFALPQIERDFATQLIPFFDPYKPGLPEHVKEIIAIEELGDLIALNMAQAPLVARAQVNSDNAIEAFYSVVEYRLSQKELIPWMDSYPWVALQIALRQPANNLKLLELAERCIHVMQNDPRKWLAVHKTLPEPWLDTLAAGLVSYMILNSLHTETITSPLLDVWINRALENNDVEYLRDFVRESRIAFEMGFHKVALQGLTLIAHFQDQQIQEDVTELLIRIRHYFPEDVESVLLQEIFSESVNQQVWAASPSERVNDLLGIRATGIFYDSFLLGPEILRQEMMWLATRAKTFSSLEDWVTLIIKEMLNLAVNEAIFPVPEDSPSRLLLSDKLSLSTSKR